MILPTGLLARKPRSQAAECALFHVTHWKAGSQWFRGVLQEVFGERLVAQEYYVQHVWACPLELGRVYPCCYLGKPEFDALRQPGEHRELVLIRDLRDTLVSAYFSFRNSHEIKVSEMAALRQTLCSLNQEEGLLYLLETWLCRSARIQRTWVGTGVPWFRLEDCMREPGPMLRRMLAEGWGIEMSSPLLTTVTARHSFATLSGGRAPGQEDAHSHYRKGVAGDWRQHFTPTITRRFKELYNDVLLDTSYETHAAW